MTDTKKHEVEQENATLSPSQSVEDNLAKGVDEEIPDPDDIPGGLTSSLQSRPNLMDADGNASEQEKELNPHSSHQ